MPEATAEEDLVLLLAAVRAAGAVARAQWRRSARHWEKADGQGPVSDADLAANRALAATLRPARPSYGWLSEEDPDTPDRLSARRLFVVDPIDGTRAFLAGEPGFAVVAAVVEEARPLAAAVHLPARSETYAAARGSRAWRERGGARSGLAPSARTAPEGAEVIASKASLAPEHWPGGPPPIRRRGRSSLAWRICLAAAGETDATLTAAPAWEWDVAAGCLIAEAAGCRVSDLDGHALAFNGPTPRVPSLLVAPPALHRALLAFRRPA